MTIEKQLKEENENLELRIKKFGKYFDILRRNDAPIINDFPILEFLTKGLPTHRQILIKKDNHEFYKTIPIKNKTEAIEEFRKLCWGG